MSEDTNNQPSIYDIVGEEGLTRLVAAFYRQVREDNLLSPMYPQQDWEGSEQRLRDFLIYRFGGPPRYIEQRGHPRLRARHLPFPVDMAARDRWMQLMENALTEAAFPQNVTQALHRFFDGTATFMMNR